MPSPPAADSDEPADAILIGKVRSGDLDAYGVLLRRELPRLRAFIALRLPVSHLVDEIAHEAFGFAFHHLADFEAGKPFRPWLRAIAWNLVRKELPRCAREQENLSKLERTLKLGWERRKGNGKVRRAAGRRGIARGVGLGKRG